MNTKKTKKQSYMIVAGPNKDALFDACKYAYNKNAEVPICFTVAKCRPSEYDKSPYGVYAITMTDIKIVSIMHEDGSGESFILQGYCKADPDCFNGKNLIQNWFHAYYDTQSREGWITYPTEIN